jgi:hypothetical protein
MRNSVADLARAKARDWFAYAERAGKAQARIVDDLAYRDRPVVPPGNAAARDDDPISPVAWRGAPPGEFGERPATPPSEKDGEPRVEPAQTAPGDWIVPGLLWLFGGLAAGAETKRRLDQSREDADEREKRGGRTELIPPRVPNEPFRGPDPANPPLKPHEMRPAPSPSEPPPNLPNRNENIPPRVDPRDYILITPDQSEEWAKYIFIERRGNPDTRTGLQIVAAAGRNVAKDRPDVRILHIGGSRDENGLEVKEFWARNRDRASAGEDARKGGSYADITLPVGKSKIIHISFYRARADGSPKPIEIEQAERLAYNTRVPNVVVMIQNKYGKEAINQKGVEDFIKSVVDAVLSGAGSEHINVRDPQVRDQIIRYFDAYKPK